uniref:Palmitoyltransferase n=1 Tax=Globisporangium ultimum (strain ATCC 200006 / CBS 805.95 / DAOM BR144) TaxID=431595 RepID=K3W830_GLOUD
MSAILRRAFQYVFYERNPLTQCLYVSVMCAAYFLFVQEAHPLIPNAYVDAYHKWIAAVLFVVCFGYYIFMCRSEPGVIHAHNLSEFTRYPTHPVLFPEGKYCRTCKTPNCIWFNGCVGEKNYKHFLAFLVAKEVLEARKQSGETKDQFARVEMAAALQHIVSRNQSLGFVAAVSLMIGLVVWLFILMQLRRIALNTTANESFKRDDLYEAAELDGETTGRKMFSVLMQQLRRKVRKGNANSSMPRSARKKDLDSSWGGLFSADLILNTEESFSVSDVKYNPYDLGGFWNNLKDALQVKPRKQLTKDEKKQQ